MCGIAGFFVPGGLDRSASPILERMGRAIGYRGPDGRGLWTDGAAGIALVHNRLAIIDLTASGAQPMHSANGRWVMAFNGEIYNFERIRATLDAEPQPPVWHGHSDTEVLLEAIARWGIRRALEATIGMFAILLWDRHERQLTLARDRAGEKPLYFGWCGQTLLFGSELKALREHPGFDARIDPAAMAAYMRFGYVPGPLSIYRGIGKLPQGTFATFAADKRTPATVSYWTPPQMRPDPDLNDDERAANELEALLSDAVRLQMRADVPMGAFLSGGIDSSAIVALMQQQTSRPVKTFSIGFEDAQYDEAKHAAAVAHHLGTAHHELYVTPQDALDVVPLLPAMYDEPFADSSQIPTHLLAKLTREHVTVSLSGDAGDELFGGYTRYFQSGQFDRLLATTPAWARTGIASVMRAVPPATWDVVARHAPGRLAGSLTRGRVPKIAAALECPDIYAVYRRLVSQWKDPQEIIPDICEPAGWMDDSALRTASPDVASWMMSVDFRTYLPDDILVKVDRASMAVSLESRVPMLDWRVVEFAARLPLAQKISGGVGKHVLRRVLYRHVPRLLLERPKQGFGVPIGAWLRGPLREWAEDLLQPTELADGGLLDPMPIRAAWARHLSGAEDLQYPLWVVLIFQSWRRSITAGELQEVA